MELTELQKLGMLVCCAGIYFSYLDNKLEEFK